MLVALCPLLGGGKWDGMTLPRRESGSFNGLVPSRLKTEELPRMGLKCHDR